jgi:hypothetical protein
MPMDTITLKPTDVYTIPIGLKNPTDGSVELIAAGADAAGAPGVRVAELLLRRPIGNVGHRRLAKPVISGDEVVGMLQAAKAPETWTMERANFLAACMNRPVEFVSYRNGPPTLAEREEKKRASKRHENRTVMHRVQDAVDTLRRDLPGIIDTLRFMNWDTAQHSGRGQRHKIVEEQVAILDDFLGSLAALPRFPPPRPRTWWHLEAARLFGLYRREVDTNAPIDDPDAPAIIFIALALKRMGYSQHSRRTITNVLRGITNERLSWFDQVLRQSPDLWLDPTLGVGPLGASPGDYVADLANAVVTTQLAPTAAGPRSPTP